MICGITSLHNSLSSVIAPTSVPPLCVTRPSFKKEGGKVFGVFVLFLFLKGGGGEGEKRRKKQHPKQPQHKLRLVLPL